MTPHTFFSPTNLVLFTTLAGAMAADAISTQWFLSAEVQARHHNNLIEANPIARPFVTKGWKGQLFISSVAFASTVGGAAIAHHFGHHAVERVIVLAVTAASGFFAYHNLQN